MDDIQKDMDELQRDEDSFVGGSRGIDTTPSDGDEIFIPPIGFMYKNDNGTTFEVVAIGRKKLLGIWKYGEYNSEIEESLPIDCEFIQSDEWRMK